MKKKALFILPLVALFGVLAFAFKPVSYSPAFAEGDEVSEIIPSQEDVSASEEASSEEIAKWKELYENALKKLNEAKQTEFLGTTVGAIVGIVMSLFLTWLFNKANRESVRSLQDFGRNALETGKRFFDKGQECLEEGKECLNKANALMGKVEELLKANEEQKVAYEKKLAEEKANHKEEINALLAIVSSNPDLVASGTAEKLNRLLRKD